MILIPDSNTSSSVKRISSESTHSGAHPLTEPKTIASTVEISVASTPINSDIRPPYQIIAESTLSFMGIGLPLEQISWGSMLSNADKALMTKSWWIILIPGLFLTATLMCMTNLGNYLRKAVNRKESYL